MSLYYFLVTFEVIVAYALFIVACALFIVGSYHGKLRILDIHARMVVNYSFNFHLTSVIFLFVSINYKSISNKGNLSEFIEGWTRSLFLFFMEELGMEKWVAWKL